MLEHKLLGTPIRRWIVLAAAAIAIVLVALVRATGRIRHAWAIYKLNRGVGDTVFYDADDRPWFRLDEQRQDVPVQPNLHLLQGRRHRGRGSPLLPASGHRSHWPDAEPSSTTSGARASGRQHDHTAAGAHAVSLEHAHLRTQGQGSRPVGDAGDLPLEAGDSPALHEPHLPRQRDLRRRGDVAADVRETGGRSHAGRGRSAGGRHSRTRVVFTVESTRARACAKLHRAAAHARGREDHGRAGSKRRGARRLRVRPASSPANGRHRYAKEFLRQQFRELDRRRQPAGLESPDDVRAGSAGRGGDRPCATGCAASVFRVSRRRWSRSIRAPATCWRSSADRTFRRRRSTARHAAIASLDPRSSHSSTRRRSNRGSRLFRRSADFSRWRCRRPKGVWIPRDDRAKTHDTMTLREALLESSNAAAVLLQQRVGARPVIKLANDMGVPNQPDVPSLALGSGLVTPLELTAAYAVFPGMGYRVSPSWRGGRRRRRRRSRSSTSTSSASRCCPSRSRTRWCRCFRTSRAAGPRRASSARGLPMEVGRQDGHDERFARRVVRRLLLVVVAGVWIGFDDPQTIRSDASGSRMALPIWADFMRRTARRLPAAAVRAAASPAHRGDVLASHITARSTGARATWSTSSRATTFPRSSVSCTQAA